MTTLNSLECNSQTSSEQGSIRYSNTAYAMWVGYNYRKRRRPSWAALHIGATTIASCVTLSAAIGSRVGSCSPVAVLHPVIPAHTLCLMNAIHEETVKSYWRSNKRLKMRMEFHRPTSKTSTAVAVDHVLYRSRNLALMWGQSNTKNSQNDGDQFPFHSQINYDNMLDQFSPWLAPKNISNAKKYNIEVFSDSINHNGHIISATHFEDLNNQDESLEQIRILDGKNFTQHLGQDYTPTSTTLIKNHSSSVYTHEHYEVNYDLEGYDATAFNVVDGDQSDGTSMMGIDNLNEYSNARRSNVFNSDMASTRQNTLTTNGENRRRYVDKAEMQQTRIFRASEYSNVNSSPKKSINDTNVNYSSTNSENAAQLRLRHQGWEEPARRDEANCEQQHSLEMRNELYSNWLDRTTDFVLHRVPLGRLTFHDVGVVHQLMAGWSRRRSVEAAITVEHLLKRVLDDYHAGNERCSVNTRMYTMVIQSWALSGQVGASKRAQEIFENMVDTYKETKDPDLQPDLYSFNAVLNAIAKGGVRGAAFEAEDILSRMQTLYDRGENYLVRPDTIAYSLTIDAWSREVLLCDKDYAKDFYSLASRRVIEIIDTMEELQANGVQSVNPNVYTYSAAINCLARMQQQQYAEVADALLSRMTEISKLPGRECASPNVVTYNSVMNAWARSGAVDAPYHAERVFRRMEELERTGLGQLIPDATSYNTIIYIWTKSFHKNAVNRAEEILKQFEAQKNEMRRPTTKSYNFVLVAWAKCGSKEGADRAVELLRTMQKLQEAGDQSARPDFVSYNSVMSAIARTRLSEAALKAESIFNEMYDRYKNGDEMARPTVRTFTALLDAWAKSPSSEKDVAPIRCESILQRLEQISRDNGLNIAADVYCYTIAIRCWARSGAFGAAQKAENLLIKMVNLYEAGDKAVKPTVRTYNAVIDAWSKSGDSRAIEHCLRLLNDLIKLYEAGDDDFAPDGFTFNSVINLISRSGRPDASKKVEELFAVMQNLHARGNRQCQPDGRSYYSRIYCWTRDRTLESSERAESILRELLDKVKLGDTRLAPKLPHFLMVMDSYAKSSGRNIGKRSESILELMQEMHDTHVSELPPTAMCWKSVLEAYAHCENKDSAIHATRILQRIDEFERSLGDETFKPSPYDFIVCLNAWAKSRLPRKAFYCRRVLNMLVSRCQPGNEFVSACVHAYSIVINACAFSAGDIREQREAFDIATTTLRELLESPYGEPNAITFGTYLKACGKLRIGANHARREKEAITAFKKCCQNGRVDDFVLSQAKLAISDKALSDLLIRKEVSLQEAASVSSLPQEWTRHRDVR